MGRKQPSALDAPSMAQAEMSAADAAYAHAVEVCDHLVAELDKELEGYHVRHRQSAGPCCPDKP